MHDDEVPVLSAAQLRALAAAHDGAPCPACASIRAAGWEALPGALPREALRRVGTLRRPHAEEPTLEEYHPQGTHNWSPEAPVAPAFFPYNRCDVCACVQCGRPFLRYTEYGGYYVEERVRELHGRQVAEPPTQE